MAYSFTLFQFHKGTVKTLTCEYESCSLPSFNSIKVRLRHAIKTFLIPLSAVSIP